MIWCEVEVHLIHLPVDIQLFYHYFLLKTLFLLPLIGFGTPEASLDYYTQLTVLKDCVYMYVYTHTLPKAAETKQSSDLKC